MLLCSLSWDVLLQHADAEEHAKQGCICRLVSLEQNKTARTAAVSSIPVAPGKAKCWVRTIDLLNEKHPNLQTCAFDGHGNKWGFGCVGDVGRALCPPQSNNGPIEMSGAGSA